MAFLYFSHYTEGNGGRSENIHTCLSACACYSKSGKKTNQEQTKQNKSKEKQTKEIKTNKEHLIIAHVNRDTLIVCLQISSHLEKNAEKLHVWTYKVSVGLSTLLMVKLNSLEQLIC